MDGGLNPLVSILTPTYNHERYIGDCIESVLAQTYTNWEQIVIDDGSSDGTGRIVSRFRDPRIHYYHQTNRGIFRLAETYNRALGLCRGALIAPLEGDDLWPAGRLTAQVPAFADSGVVVSHGVCRFAGDGTTAGIVFPPAEVRETYGDSPLFNDPTGAISRAMLHLGSVLTSATTALIRRSALEEIGGFQIAAGLPVMDYPTFLELGLKGKFCFVDRVLCHWRKHDTNSSLRHQDVIPEGCYRCALQFVEKHGSGKHFRLLSRDEIGECWEKRKARRAFFEGRRLLVEEQWKEARARFQAAFRSREFEVRAGAVCGTAASYLQFDLEALMRVAGRHTLRPASGGKSAGPGRLFARS